MPSQLNPYLVFQGNARGAMTRYHEIFGGELQIMSFGDAGAEGVPDPDGVMHAYLATPQGYALMASDGPPGAEVTRGDNVVVSLSGDDETALRGFWDALSADGAVFVPLEVQMWGDTFGQCTDRFGVSWMVNIAGSGGASAD